MRLALAALLVTALVVSPSAMAGAAPKSCRIDLHDPTSPEIYGDCIDVQTTSGPDTTTVSVRGQSGTYVLLDDPTEVLCGQRQCEFAVGAGASLEIIFRDGAPPDFIFHSWGSWETPDALVCVANTVVVYEC